MRVGAQTGEDETRRIEQIGQRGGIAFHGGDELGQRGTGRAGDLELTTGFDRDGGAVWQRTLGTVGDKRIRHVLAKRLGEMPGLQQAMGVAGMLHHPLELGAEQLGRSVLETHRRDVDLGLFPTAQHRGRGDRR
jgi:hypothetical protein